LSEMGRRRRRRGSDSPVGHAPALVVHGFGGRLGERETETGGSETERRDRDFLLALPLVWVDVIFPVKSTGERDFPTE
jgi:hypothetical protein